MLKHDPVHVGVLAARDRTGVQRVPGRAVGVLADPHIQVLVPRPLDEGLHLGVAHVRQFADDAVEARVAIAVGVLLGQTEFNLHVRHQIGEVGVHLARAFVQSAEVGVQHVHGVVDLGSRNVFWAVEVDDVEHHRDHQHLGTIPRQFTLLGFQFQLALGLQCRSARARTKRKQLGMGVMQSARVGLSGGGGLGQQRGWQPSARHREGKQQGGGLQIHERVFWQGREFTQFPTELRPSRPRMHQGRSKRMPTSEMSVIGSVRIPCVTSRK